MMANYFITRASSDKLKHHGIPGQQWGVRRGPPYPIEDKTLKKGTRLSSVSSVYRDSDEYKNTGKPMYTYNPNDEYDSRIYKGPFSVYNIMARGARFIAEHEYEVVSDLKMPTKKERVNEFKDLYNSKKYNKQIIKEMSAVQNSLIEQHIGGGKFDNFSVKNIKTDEDWLKAYEIFQHAMETQHMYKSTSEYMKRMASKYDAMVDDNNQSIYNGAHDPVIIFRANEALKSIGNVKYLTLDEIMNNYDVVEKIRNEEGKRIMLSDI